MISIVSERAPWDPEKLKKPRELRGVRPFMSYRWGGCTACQAFIHGDDLWVKHNDWCSYVAYRNQCSSAPVRRGNGAYVYSDNFAPSVIVRGQAWLRLEGVLALDWADATFMIDVETGDGTRFCMDDWRMLRDVFDAAYAEVEMGVYG